MADISPFQAACFVIVSTFEKYASKDGKSKTLSKYEFKEFLKNEMPCPAEGPKNPAQFDKMMNELDQNGDQEIDFPEYLSLLGAFTYACFEICQMQK
ncbi:protein S100-A11-like [Paralichthys olivaceus]|uniref:protein S100-A11-like n=1 Tax=Paralichthys olivaceus TaxID=8255 RepID=UPI003750A494